MYGLGGLMLRSALHFRLILLSRRTGSDGDSMAGTPRAKAERDWRQRARPGRLRSMAHSKP